MLSVFTVKKLKKGGKEEGLAGAGALPGMQRI
jgi:hypothetical protein